MLTAVKNIHLYLDQYDPLPKHVDDIIHGACFKGDSVVELKRSHLTEVLEHIEQLRESLSWSLEYIDAIPSDVADNFPTMPGFDREYVDGLLKKTKA